MIRLCMHVHARNYSMSHSLALVGLSFCSGFILCFLLCRIMAVSVMAAHGVSAELRYCTGMVLGFYFSLCMMQVSMVVPN